MWTQKTAVTVKSLAADDEFMETQDSAPYKNPLREEYGSSDDSENPEEKKVPTTPWRPSVKHKPV